MSDTRWLTDYSSWPPKTRTRAPWAALVALLLFWLIFDWHFLLSLVLALLVLVAVVRLTRDTAIADPWVNAPPRAPAPPPAPPPAPAPAHPAATTPASAPSATPAATMVDAPVVDAPVVDTPVAPPGAEAMASERVRAAARAAGEAARLMDAPIEAIRPAGLDGPRGGIADDLKKIRGVGPKLEGLLNSLGFYHFDQIAAWGAPEVSWVDSNLEGFNGRVTRDDWVAQARVLAAGGVTDFSDRVERGEVRDD